MGIIITPIQDFILLNPDLVKKTLYRELTIAKTSVDEISGIVPGSFAFRDINADPTLADCCQVPTGSTTVTEKMSEAKCIMTGDEYCETDLAKIMSNAVAEAERVRFTAGAESAGSIAEYVIDINKAAWVKKLEKLTWQGDKTLADVNMNKVNGLLTIAEAAGSGTIPVDLTGYTNAFYALNMLAMNMPEDAESMGGLGMFVPYNIYDAYFTAAAYLNHYKFDVPQLDTVARPDRPMVNMAGVTIIPTRGLNGTNKIIYTPLKNIVWFNSRRDDHNTLDWDYTKYHQKYYWRIKTVIGVDFRNNEWVVVGTFGNNLIGQLPRVDVNITNNPLITSSTITAPLGANGGVLTTDTP